MISTHYKRVACHPLLLIIGIGLLLRLISWHLTYVVNPDAMVYIAQAKAIYFGNGEARLTGLNYLSPYSILIAGFYRFMGNWVVSATLISILFGVATLFPMYKFLREYFEKNHALLTTLIFSMLPVFVSRSVDIIKDPMYWFFLSLGLWLFAAQIGKNRYFYSFLSLMFFVIAAFIRIEAALFVVVSFGFILLFERQYRLKLLILTIPLFFTYIIAKTNLFEINLIVSQFARTNKIVSSAAHITENYRELRQNISMLSSQQEMPLSLFLMEAKRNVWLLAFEKMLNSFLEGVAYLPGILFFMGLGTLKTFKQDKKKVYCLLLLLTSFILLYFFTISYWIMPYRYMALFIIPSMVVIGYGLTKCTDIAARRWGIKSSTTLILILSMILAVSVTKALKPRQIEQLPYKQAGTLLFNIEGNDQPITIASDTMTMGASCISFYANLNYDGYLKLNERDDSITQVSSNDPNLISLLRDKKIKYCMINSALWDETILKRLMEQNGSSFTILWTMDEPVKGKTFLIQIKETT